MGKHEVTGTPSQVAHPWRAMFRTVLQVLIPGLLLVIFAGPAVLQILAEELGAVFPPGFIMWLLGASAVLSALAGALSRVAALPQVNAWLARFKLDAGSPRG